ncbi:Bikaverin cluster transcription factor bik5 [Hyphodiscus hymeniophilus]|uniref:Bikaverin cluster transcription factor bik5 n=1 Tax=Hyphodiscus hymeniophilus TaxID=353542 RepID=A0A9P6VSQ2_9HELO|nr:Bikaverin cluster transcription factor bik5 [Hyphodiscus hymeniophilus]
MSSMSISSSNEGTGRSPPGTLGQEPRVSCVTCKKRKVRCDKGYPCGNCSRRSIDCVYVRVGKRKTRGPGKQRAGERIEQMTNRVAQLEQVLGKLQSRDHGDSIPEEAPPSVRVVSTRADSTRTAQDEEGNELDHSAARLLVKEGKTQYIRNNFWATINNELDESDEQGENPYPTPDLSHVQEPSPVTSSSHSLLFGSLGDSTGLAMLRPPAFQVRMYWQLYTHPIYKFLHRPSMESIITTASTSKPLSPSNEALMFGIYYAAIISLSARKVQSTFHDSKEQLVSRYRCGLERALNSAGLLATQEMSTLQAFVLLIVCIRRDDDARAVWALVGLATRLAIGMGLQHDGTKFNMNPLETEKRRRLWWQIYLLDVRAAEDQGCEVTIAEDSFDTKVPLNINDDDLVAGATELPPERTGLTEMTTSVMRLDVVATGRKIRTVDSGLSGDQNLTLREKLEAIKSCERAIHHKYLQYCRPDVPITVFMYTLAKHCIAKMSLMAHQPDVRIRSGDDVSSTATKPELSRDELFIMSMSILESSQFLESAPELEPWAWVSRKYVQWHPMAYVLMELNSPLRQPGPLVDRAWRVLDSKWRDNVERTADRSNDSIGIPIEKLLMKARRRRAETTKIPEAQNVTSLQELEQWNLQQVQDVGSSTENFDWFMGVGDQAMIANAGGYVQQLATPVSLPLQDAEFWNDMTGLLQYQPCDNNGAIGGGEMGDWW